MPEGHTIYLFAQAHRRAFAKKVVAVSSPQGRFAKGAASIDGCILRNAWSHGKNLFYEFDNKRFLHIHLGLHGHFTLQKLKKGESAPPPRGTVRMRMLSEKVLLDLNGPIICQVVDRAGVDKVNSKLGPDVLDPEADSAAVGASIRKSGRSIAELLMDQSIVCGIGNAYRCELLYRQRLHPLVAGKSLTQKQFSKLWKDAVHLLKLGVSQGRTWAVDETAGKHPSSNEVGEPDRYNVYRRKICRGCGGKIEIIMLGGRKCHYCLKEQKRKRNPG